MTFSPSVVVTDEAMHVMLTAGLTALPREIGGILAGFRAEDQVVVTRAAVVTDAGSSRRDYQLLKHHAADELTRLKAGAAPVVGFVGDWHTHPADVPPSSIDIASLEVVARAAGDMVALIVLPFADGKPRPAHGRVGCRLGSSRLIRRAQVSIHYAPISTTNTTASDLERSAMLA
ncbi:Mov34/MPN/PAD-1 family protein [Rhodococcus sp. NPDC054953]